MYGIKTLIVAGGALAALSAGAAQAQTVKFENAVARVVYMPEARSDIAVEITNGSASLPALTVTRNGSSVNINGGLERNWRSSRISQCHRSNAQGPASQPGVGSSVSVRGVGRIELSEAPLVVVRGPLSARIEAEGGVYGSVGPGATSVKLSSGGCGDWVIANVSGNSDINIGGSGRIWTGSTRNLDVSIGGSGDVYARSADELSISIGGSGNVRVMRLDESARISIAGSGDVQIEQGRLDDLSASIAGSGNVVFGGTVHDVSVNIVGSGDVRLNEVTGNVSQRVMGSGKVRIARQGQ